MKRLLTDSEKVEVRKHQIDSDGVLRCFISGQIIGDDDLIEYDHIQAFAKEGETSLANIRVVIKELNRRKGAETLYDVRDNLRLERLFEDRKNNIRLQDIFELKDVAKRTTAATLTEDAILVQDDDNKLRFPLYHDAILDVPYFYPFIPLTHVGASASRAYEQEPFSQPRLFGPRVFPALPRRSRLPRSHHGGAVRRDAVRLHGLWQGRIAPQAGEAPHLRLRRLRSPR